MREWTLSECLSPHPKRKRNKTAMNKNRLTYLLNLILPAVVFSAIAGALTAIIIFIFKMSSSYVISLSEKIYAFGQADMRFLSLILIGAALAGFIVSIILKYSPDSRGGGIPTAIAALRGYVPFNKKRGLITVFFSSMFTYLCGIPLGTEGPSVQMGALTGHIVSKTLGKKHPAWERYIMTGSACAGFGVATGSPLTGIFFAFEEAHRRFSPMIFMVAAMTVAFSTAVNELLCSAFSVSSKLFHFGLVETLPIRSIWLAALVGLVSGVLALVFTKLYGFVKELDKKAEKIPSALKIPIVFLLCAFVGFLSYDIIGTGHSIIEELAEGKGILNFLLICFCARAILMITSNVLGITGGLFIPNLAFGAIIGALCARLMIWCGVLGTEHIAIVVVIGMVSFLGATSRIPISAIVFGVEALAGAKAVLAITVGVTIAFVVSEAMGIESFTDTVIHGKVEKYSHGREIVTIDAYVTVTEGAFVIGKEIRDILWPPSCVIVSVNNAISASRIGSGMAVGDVLHIHCQSTHPSVTARDIEALVGKQNFDITKGSHSDNLTKQVPDA